MRSVGRLPRHRPCWGLWHVVNDGNSLGTGCAGGGIYRCRCVDETGTTLLRDPYQWPLAHSESGRDKALKLYSSLWSCAVRTLQLVFLERGPWQCQACGRTGCSTPVLMVRTTATTFTDNYPQLGVWPWYLVL